MTEGYNCNGVRFINNPEMCLIPEPIQRFLHDLNEKGMSVDGANEVMTSYTEELHPQGWSFHLLNDAFGEEWNFSCRPPESLKSYCLQRFNAIEDDPWECYIVEHKP